MRVRVRRRGRLVWEGESTVAALEHGGIDLARAEVLLYDALIDPALLELVPPGCERIDVGKRGDGTRGEPQESISELMIARARAGRRVASSWASCPIASSSPSCSVPPPPAAPRHLPLRRRC